MCEKFIIHGLSLYLGYIWEIFLYRVKLLMGVFFAFNLVKR